MNDFYQGCYGICGLGYVPLWHMLPVIAIMNIIGLYCIHRHSNYISLIRSVSRYNINRGRRSSIPRRGWAREGGKEGGQFPGTLRFLGYALVNVLDASS